MSEPTKKERSMKTVTVYGASDDLVEVEGDISEEFGAYQSGDPEPLYMGFSDGTVLEIKYDGFWRIHVRHKGTSEIRKVEGTDEDTDYSDKVTLIGPDLHCCIFGPHFAKAGK